MRRIIHKQYRYGRRWELHEVHKASGNQYSGSKILCEYRRLYSFVKLISTFPWIKYNSGAICFMAAAQNHHYCYHHHHRYHRHIPTFGKSRGWGLSNFASYSGGGFNINSGTLWSFEVFLRHSRPWVSNPLRPPPPPICVIRPAATFVRCVCTIKSAQ